MRHSYGAAQQAVDGKPRTAGEIADALGLARRTVWGALQAMQGEEFRRPALVAVSSVLPPTHARVWMITGAGRLSIRPQVTK